MALYSSSVILTALYPETENIRNRSRGENMRRNANIQSHFQLIIRMFFGLRRLGAAFWGLGLTQSHDTIKSLPNICVASSRDAQSGAEAQQSKALYVYHLILLNLI